MVNPSNNVIAKKLPVGNVGEVTRKHDSKIISVQVKEGEETLLCGDSAGINEGAIALKNGTITSYDDLKGFIIRSYPTQQEEPFKYGSIVDVLISGYILVKLGKGTVHNGSKLAIAKDAEGSEGGYKKGDIVQYNSGDNKLVLLPNTWSTGEAKAGDIVEIAFNI